LALAQELGLGGRRDDPLSLVRETNDGIYRSFEYSPLSTHVNSPIDDALRIRRGVCQDFAHIFIALVRQLGVPCRYVSGYLEHRNGVGGDRSAEDGSHAWVEAFLPELGWVGFDPTNNMLAGERHIRVALGRDYADVPPNRGMYKGKARSTLRVGVHVARANFMVHDEEMPELARVTQEQEADADEAVIRAAQQ
jgi:transglutaminase-like putative cysteine protease